jgi:hypothetical protein
MHRVADMSITAHANRRDKLSFWASFLEMSALVLSISVLAVTFADSASLNDKGGFWSYFFTALPWIGVLVFVLTMLQLKYDPRGQSALHRQAVSTLAPLKSELGGLLKEEDDAELAKEYDRVRRYYDLAMGSCPSIKEGHFLSLKAKHNNKIRISKHLDQYPSTTILLFRLKLWVSDNFCSKGGDKNDKH